MGIPRLSQDLNPYAERVYLGTSPLSISAHKIDQLVIDGPSLVYLIYNKLLAYRASRSPVLDGGLPRYAEINQGFHHFLSDLEKCGVHVHHIFFDGGLPSWKRSVRLDRVEKVRLQLELYRTLHPLDPMVSPVGDIQFEEALWTTSTMSTRKAMPPPPPFMVASLIESLRDSKWKDLVNVVPDEADSYCAQAASEISAAVLTNDSDLAVHDLGSSGSLALLGSIEKKSSGQGKDKTLLTILSLNPKTVAERLGVPSLLHFGFERYLDSSLSAAIVRERARDESRLESLRTEYDNFAEQYLSSRARSAAPFLLDDVDPRTAELIVSTPDSPHVYLTPMLEDPSRDSSWSYGAEVRKLAFSLLAWSIPRPGLKAVTESLRKGQRITSTTVPQLSNTQLEERICQMVHTLEQSFATAATTTPPNKASSTLFLDWYILSANMVQQQKLELGKHPVSLSLIQSSLGLMNWRSGDRPRTSWDEIHFLANMHAVLYSLRILKQIAEYILRGRHQVPKSTVDKNGTNDGEEPIEVLTRELAAILNTMPPIEDLFLDVADIRSKIHELNVETRNAAIVRLTNPMDDVDEHEHKSHTVVGDPHNVKNSEAIPEDEWTTSKRKRKRKRASARKGNNDTTVDRKGTGNSFDALMYT